ncbi:MAG: hypothetical protein MUO26_08390 [Methanotrichaceae archaeon]|nr:hypothetical protein [Methanotrichaceae archaeon]
MKIILSRKGFDSSFGGYPSPILPDGTMVSLPIPLKDNLRYSDLVVKDGLTYYDLMRLLRSKIRIGGQWQELEKETKCHLDPDICRNIIPRKPGWKPCFGQIDSAQRHLEKQGVGEGDLFLFFGWFRKARNHQGKLEFDPNEGNLHAIFGYMQIDEIMKITDKRAVPDWLKYHPHNSENRRKNKTNTIYMAKSHLSWNNQLPDAGNFKFNEILVLTKEGLTRSKWCLPEFFKATEISYHSKDSWKDGYFQSVARGQEFVIKDNKEVEEWARRLVEGSVLAPN